MDLPVRPSDPEPEPAPVEASAIRDPIRKYLTEAARTPLLQRDEERCLATRMARRRELFRTLAAAVPGAWLELVRLVRSSLEGKVPPSKVFALGGVSEAAFHRHLRRSAEIAGRLEEIARRVCGATCLKHEVDSELLAEGRRLARELNLRIPPLRQVLSRARAAMPARGSCTVCRRMIRDARRIFAAYGETRNRLVSANLRLVVHVAKQVARHPAQLLDLIQEGNFGLLYATEKYDPLEACQFHSYAFWWIKQSMTRAIATKTKLGSLPQDLSDLPPHIRAEVQRFRSVHGRDPSPDELRRRLRLGRADAQRWYRAAVRSFSLDQAPNGDEEEGPAYARLAAPAVDAPNLDLPWVANGLAEVLETLTPREREVLQLRFGLGQSETYTLENIARIYNLSRERVRQIEIKALGKLREPDRIARLRRLMDAIE